MEFERLEIKPQALEWMFSTACAKPFRVSADNLNSGLAASDLFKNRIAQQAQIYCINLPERPAHFIAALTDFYGSGEVLDPALYTSEHLL